MIEIKELDVNDLMSFLDVRAFHTKAANQWLELPPPPLKEHEQSTLLEQVAPHVVVYQSPRPLAKGLID